MLHHPSTMTGNNDTWWEQTGVECLTLHHNDSNRRGDKVECLACHLQPTYTKSVAAFLRGSGHGEPPCHHSGW